MEYTLWNDGTELYHYGIQGQKWGVRRYQNEDGTYTEEGRRRYYTSSGELNSRGLRKVRKLNRYRNKMIRKNSKEIRRYDKRMADTERHIENVKKYGADSKEFKRYVESQMEPTTSTTYDVSTGGYTTTWDISATIRNNRKRAEMYAKSNMYVSDLKKQYENTYKEYKSNSARYKRGYNKLMNMEIDALMDKSDIKRTARNS